MTDLYSHYDDFDTQAFGRGLHEVSKNKDEDRIISIFVFMSE